MGGHVAGVRVFDNITITTGATSTSSAFRIDAAQYDSFSLHVTAFSGTAPDVDISYLVGDEEGGTFTAPGSPLIVDGASGVSVTGFVPEMGRYLKIKALNNSANSVTLTAKVFFQEIG